MIDSLLSTVAFTFNLRRYNTASMVGKDLNLALGFAHPVLLPLPKGLKVEVTSPTELTVSGRDSWIVLATS